MMLFKLLSHLDLGDFQSSVISLIDKGVMGGKIETLDVPVCEVRMIPGTLKLSRLGEAARRRIEQNFSMDSIAAEYTALYSEVGLQ